MKVKQGTMRNARVGKDGGVVRKGAKEVNVIKIYCIHIWQHYNKTLSLSS